LPSFPVLRFVCHLVPSTAGRQVGLADLVAQISAVSRVVVLLSVLDSGLSLLPLRVNESTVDVHLNRRLASESLLTIISIVVVIVQSKYSFKIESQSARDLTPKLHLIFSESGVCIDCMLAFEAEGQVNQEG